MSQESTTQRALVDVVDGARAAGTTEDGPGEERAGAAELGPEPGGATARRPGTTETEHGVTERATEPSEEPPRVNVFQVGDTYLFRRYFEESAVFDALERFYNRRRYRFEVPSEAYRDVEGLLAGHGYEVSVVDQPADYAVVVRKYSDHPEETFEDAVFQVSTDEYNVFLLTDTDAVDRAVAAGATRLTDTPLRLKLPASPGVGPVTVADLADGTRA